MIPTLRLGSLRLLALACFASFAALGCGTSDYEKLLNARLHSSNELAPYENFLFEEVTVPDSRVTLRPPKFPDTLAKAFNDHSPDEFDQAVRVDPARVLPPFLRPVPGHKITYEGRIKPDKNEPAIACYFYVAGMESKGAPNVAATILPLVARAFPGKAPAWEDVDVTTYDGQTTKWKRIKVHGPQDFVVTNSGNNGVETKREPGTFEIWMHEEADYIVLLGWRAPDSLKEQFDIDNLAKLTVATVKIAPAPTEEAK